MVWPERVSAKSVLRIKSHGVPDDVQYLNPHIHEESQLGGLRELGPVGKAESRDRGRVENAR